MLLDSDVIIWYLRGNKKALAKIVELKEFSISSVTYMEIVQGLRNKKELKMWKAFLKEQSVRHLLIDKEITSKAIFWMEEFFLSHNLKMADALIAATADNYGLDLMTSNVGDYTFIPGINIISFKA